MELDPTVTLGKNIEENMKIDLARKKLALFNFAHDVLRSIPLANR